MASGPLREPVSVPLRAGGRCGRNRSLQPAFGPARLSPLLVLRRHFPSGSTGATLRAPRPSPAGARPKRRTSAPARGFGVNQTGGAGASTKSIKPILYVEVTEATNEVQGADDLIDILYYCIIPLLSKSPPEGIVLHIAQSLHTLVDQKMFCARKKDLSVGLLALVSSWTGLGRLAPRPVSGASDQFA